MKRNQTPDKQIIEPTPGEKISIYNDHHTGMLTSGNIEDFKKLQDSSLDTADIEHRRDGITGKEQFIIHRKGYDDIITEQEGRKLELKDILVLEHIHELAAPLKDKYKEAFKITLSYDKYFGEVKKISGNPKQKNDLFKSLDNLSSHMISFKRVSNSGDILEGTTPFSMFTADYTKRGHVDIFVTALYNRYFLQYASVKPRSKVIQRMNPQTDATAIEIMRALDNIAGQNDPIGTDENGNKFWRVKVVELLDEITSLKGAKTAVFNLYKALPAAAGSADDYETPEDDREANEDTRERQSDIHKTMIPFILALNKCTVNYSGTRGLLYWKFVKAGGKPLSIKEKEQVTYNKKGDPTNKLCFDTFLDMTIEFYPYDPPNMRSKAERQERQENIIKKKQIKKSKREAKKKKD